MKTMEPTSIIIGLLVGFALGCWQGVAYERNRRRMVNITPYASYRTRLHDVDQALSERRAIGNVPPATEEHDGGASGRLGCGC